MATTLYQMQCFTLFCDWIIIHCMLLICPLIDGHLSLFTSWVWCTKYKFLLTNIKYLINIKIISHISPLEVVKQEMARVNINILRISDRMDKNGQINSDDHYIYYCGQESLSRHGVALTVNERVQNAVHGWQSQKWKTLVHFQRQDKKFRGVRWSLHLLEKSWNGRINDFRISEWKRKVE